MSDTTIGQEETKRRQRMTEGRLVVERAAKHITQYPHAVSTTLVRDLKNAIANLIEEVERL